MSRKFSALFLLSALLGGCLYSNHEPLAVHMDGRMKPKVVMLPIIDKTQGESISEELSLDFKESAQTKDLLYLVSKIPKIPGSSSLYPKDDPHFNGSLLSLNPAWIKELSLSAEYIVLITLLEHSLKPREGAILPTSKEELVMKAKIEVVDIRSKEPKLVLSEVFEKKQAAGLQIFRMDYNPHEWNHFLYSVSPTGKAHKLFMEEVYKHTEDYILLSKTHGY